MCFLLALVHLSKVWMDVSSVCGSRQTVSLHIPPVCQHVYPVSWSVLSVMLTCISNGRDVSSEGHSNAGNGHYQNRGLLVAQQEGSRIIPCWILVLGCLEAAASILFFSKTAAEDMMGRTDGSHVMCRRA